MTNSITMMYIFGFITRVILPLVLATYTFWDAGRRGMKRFLWAALVLLVPSFIGFVIFLLARGRALLRCAKCGTVVRADTATCPKCGAHLRPICETCGKTVSADFHVCPYCAAPLKNMTETVTPAESVREKGLGKIIAAMVMIPLASVFLFAAVSIIGEAGNGSTNVSFTETAFYLDQIQNTAIEEWIEDCDEEGKAYILRYRDEDANGEKRFWYLVYVPSWEGDSDFDAWDNESKNGVFGKKIRIDLYQNNKEKGGAIFLIRAAGSDVRKLDIYLDGLLLDKEIIDVDYPLGLFDIVANVE